MEKEKEIQEDLKKIGIPRAKTNEEVQKEVIDHIYGMMDYWTRLDDKDIQCFEGESKMHARLSGLAFSILGMLDGSSMSLPKFQVIPDPHPKDRAFKTTQGEDYYPESEPHPNDISGLLHELLAKTRSPFIKTE